MNGRAVAEEDGKCIVTQIQQQCLQNKCLKIKNQQSDFADFFNFFYPKYFQTNLFQYCALGANHFNNKWFTYSACIARQLNTGRS